MSMTSEFCLDGEYYREHTCEPCRTRFNIKKGKLSFHSRKIYSCAVLTLKLNHFGSDLNSAAGFEFTSNCGLDDHDNIVGEIYQKCRDGTFNNGSFVECEKCNQCLYVILSHCNATSNTVCCQKG